MRRPARHWPASIAAIATAGPASFPAAAAEWQATPRVALGAGGDTNIRMLPGDQHYVANTQLVAGADVVGRDAGFDFRFRPELRSLRYDDPGELDRDDIFTTLNLALPGERQTWSLGADYSRESTLTSEFESTGFVVVDVERAQSAMDLGWVRRTGPRGSVSVTTFAVDVDYQERFLSPLVDYRHKSLETAYSYATNEHATWRISASGTRVETPSLMLTTDSASLNVTWSRELAAGLTTSIGVGAFEVESVLGPFVARTSGQSATFDVDKRWSRWTFSVSGARDLRPDGRGTLSREDGVDVSAERRITERVSLAAGARAARVGSVSGREVPYARDYAQASVAVQWRVAERWDLSALLLKRAQAIPEAWRANGRQASLSVSYRGS